MDEAIQKLAEMRKHWEKYVPSLKGNFTHWWLESDGGVVIVTDDLSELLDKIQEYYCRSLKLKIYQAFHDDDGDCVRDKNAFGISDYKSDRISNRFDY